MQPPTSILPSSEIQRCAAGSKSTDVLEEQVAFACYQLHAGFLLGKLVNSYNGDMFLRIVG
jgi:hypothetical protein